MGIAAKFERGDVLAAACPSREVLQHITSRWGVFVLIALESGTLRFGELRRKVNGVSERMLVQTLQCLEGDGLVNRIAYEVVPPHVEYSLTPLGREAAEKVRLLTDWIEDNLPRLLKANVPPDLDIHLVMDNYGTHKTPTIKAWFTRHPRFHVHFTPTSASWLNQVERWFATLTEKQIRRGTHRSTRELEQAIRNYLEIHNANPKPFAWTKTADDILASIERFSLRISNSEH